MDGHQATVRLDKATRATNIWIPISGTPFLLPVFKAKGRVGLFVRPVATEASPEGRDAMKMLDSFRSVVAEKLGLVPPASTHPKLEFSMTCNPDDNTQWDTIFGWLATQIDRYSGAVKEAVKGQGE